jgi:hypothetical protein
MSEFSKGGKPIYITDHLLDMLIDVFRPVVSPLITGVSGACHEKYPMESEARAVFEEALHHGSVLTM